jgi:hypothetical protein
MIMQGANSVTDKELVAIKKLLILGLVNAGVKLSEIGAALDLDPTNVSRMFPKGTFAKKVTSRRIG